MTKNIGDADRTLRTVFGAITGVFFFGHRVGGPAETLLGVISAYLLTTVVLGWDPFYALLRISSAKPGNRRIRPSA
jgi:hypothetical protein